MRSATTSRSVGASDAEKQCSDRDVDSSTCSRFCRLVARLSPAVLVPPVDANSTSATIDAFVTLLGSPHIATALDESVALVVTLAHALALLARRATADVVDALARALHACVPLVRR